MLPSLTRTPLGTDPPAVARQKARALGAQASGIGRKAALEAFCQNNTWVDAFFAPHTFEVDFVAAGNSSKLVSIIHDVYKDPTTIAAAKADLESNDVTRYGLRVLTMAANSGKGWFAILLGKMIDHHTIIPDYILKALFFAHGPIKKELLYNVLAYRVHRIEESVLFGAPVIAAFRTQLLAFRDETLDFNGIRNAMLAAFTADEINSVLAGL
jgi:putative ATP-dependent endonuclease of OLD family